MVGVRDNVFGEFIIMVCLFLVSEQVSLHSLSRFSILVLRKNPQSGVQKYNRVPLSPAVVASFAPAVRSLKCEVCGSQFATRRGLSIHARSHLRRLGLSASEIRGASVDILRQISKQRHVDGQKQISSLLEPLSAKNPSPSDPREDEALGDMDLDEKPLPLSLLAKVAKAVRPCSSSSSPVSSPAPLRSGSPSSVVRKAPISSLLPVSSPLRSPERKAGGMKGFNSNLSNKPIWAPQENDAPLNLSEFL